MKQTKHLILIHGLFVNNTSWADWKKHFEARGFIVHTPANPFHDGKPSVLRANPLPGLRTAKFEDVVTNLVKLIDSLPEKPIVIGHSLAGLVVQKLVEMDKAVAGISIDGAPPKNVMPGLKTILAVLPVMNPFRGNSPFEGSRAWYHQNFFNSVPKTESDKLYDLFAVPESRRVARETLYVPIAKVDHRKPHVPLLFIGGEKDNIFPAAFTRKNAAAYKDKNSITDVKTFPGRTHFICGQEGWEEVADFINDWISRLTVLS